MGDTPGIPSRGLPRDSGSNFDELSSTSRNSAATPRELGEVPNLPASSEDLRESGRAAAIRFDLETPPGPPPSLPGREAPQVLDFSASYAAQAFFATPLSADNCNAETLEQALEHYRWLYPRTEAWGEFSAGSSAEHEAYLRRLANQIRSQNPEQASVETRLEELRLLAEAYSELADAGARESDRSALVEVLYAWFQDFSTHPMVEEARIADLSRIAALVERHGLEEVRPLLNDAVQSYADEWRHLSGEDPRLAIQGRQRAFRLLSGTYAALGETGRILRQDLVDELDRDALRMERASQAAEPTARLQSLGEVAAVYRLLSSYPEAAEFYQARVQATLAAILATAETDSVAPALRLQVNLQVLQELESDGAGERAAELRRAMLARAESELQRGRNLRESAIERYQACSEAQGIFRSLEDGAGVARTEAAWRRLLREMERAAGARDNPELNREVGALSVEACLQMGDLSAAEDRIGRLRDSLQAELRNTEIPESEEPNAVDPRAQWLLRLGGYAQRLAVERSEASGEPADFSHFHAILSDLSALGARTGQRTMALYGRLLRAVLDQDPVAETIYEELRDWRPPEFEAWQDTPPLFLPEEFRTYQADPFQRMAEEIWRAQAPMTTLPRAATTLQFLSLLIEGNYAGQIAGAEEEGQSTLTIREERAEMRRYLSHVQAFLVSGQASSTREAIEMLPNAVGREDAARRFYRNLGRAFAYNDLVGREHGDSSLVSRLIDSEGIADPEIRAQAWLRLAREMIVADSLNHRADGLIGAMLASAEEIGGSGRAPRPLEEILSNLGESLTMGRPCDLHDMAELQNRLAGNETLREQIQATRDSGLYVQTMNQVMDSVFSVEGGLIMLASIFTGGLAAELAGAALIARLGATAFTVVNGVSRMTWAARLAVGATRIGAAWAARSATELGGTALYRSATGHRQMSFEELRVRVITSLFCSIGDEFATHFTRAFLSRALRPVFGESTRGVARTQAWTEAAEFFSSGLGEMWGEEIGGRVAGQAADTRPFLVRYFEETLHGSFFVAGTRAGAPLSAMAMTGWQQATNLSRRLRPPGRPSLSLSSLSFPSLSRVGALGSLLGVHQTFHPSLTMASAGLSPGAALLPDGTFLGSTITILGLGVLAMAFSGNRRSGSRIPDSMSFPLMLSQYRLHEDEPAPARLTLEADPETPNRFTTSGYGFLIFRKQEGRIRGRDMRFASRLTLFDPDSGLAVDSHLPVGFSDIEVFLEDFRFLREHLETMGFGFRRARVHLVYGDNHGDTASPHPGLRLSTRLEGMGINFESIRPAGGPETAFEFDLASGALFEDSKAALDFAGAPTLPPAAPNPISQGPTFFLFDEWLESSMLLAANLPELTDFTNALGASWERREISFPEMIGMLRSYIRDRVPPEARPGLFSSLAGALASQDLIAHAHQILEGENHSLREVFPDSPEIWHSEEDIARARLIRALAENGLFEGEINPVYHLARIQSGEARYLAWRDLLTGLVVRGQTRRARDLLSAFESNPRIGTPAEERAPLRELLRDIIREYDAGPGTSNGNGNSGMIGALLAAGAGAATLLGTEVAQAAAPFAAAADSESWLPASLGLLGLGILASVFSRKGPNPPEGSPPTLARLLFQSLPRLTGAEELMREDFIARFHRLDAMRKAETLTELLRELQILAESGAPLSIHVPFLSLLLRQVDPRHALDFYQGLGRLGLDRIGELGSPLAILTKGLLRHRLLQTLPEEIRDLPSEDARRFRTPVWLNRFREVLNEHFSQELEETPAELALREILPIHYLDAHATGEGAAALNAVRRHLLRRLYLLNWRPGLGPSAAELAAALVDDESHLPLVSRPDAEGRRILLNGHHRIGALLSLVADGVLPEEVLDRLPFHVAREVEPRDLIHRAFARSPLPNPRFALNWQELLGFDEPTRDWLEARNWNLDLVEWIRAVRTEERRR